MQAHEAGHVVEESNGHQCQHDGRATALQAFQPQLGNRAARRRFEKMVHEVAAIEHRQRQQIEHAQTDADNRQKTKVVGQADANRLPRIVGDRDGGR